MFAQHKLLVTALLLSGFFLSADNMGKKSSPDAAASKGAQASTKKKSKDDCNKTKLEKRKALFKEMLEQADDSANNDAMCLSILNKAGMIAAQAGDAEDVILAVEEIRKRNKGDTTAGSINLLNLVSKKVKTPKELSGIAEDYLKLADDAIGNNNFDLAVKSANNAKLLALKMKDASLADRCKAKLNEISSSKKESRKAVGAVKKIEEIKLAGEDSSNLKPPIQELKCEIKTELPPQESTTGVPASPKETMKIEAAEVLSMAASTLEAPCKSVEEESKLKSLDLKDLTAEWLKEHRSFGSFGLGRPRPADYEFSQGALTVYLESLSGENREMEEKRARQVSGIKEYIVHLMSKIPYNKSVKLKNGKIYTGSVMVNPKYLSIRVGDGMFERVEWSSIGSDQVAQILEYYADFRIRAVGGQAVSKSKQKLESAEDYLRIGMLHDWYGNYEEAVKYAKKAFSVDQNIETSVKFYIMQ